ncbi:MAG: tetratricopeptide repeat protein, partial [Nonomuraea sp.]|nr:tetratricopeptide repeat protein [Nonomuraea sp.]
PLGSPAEAAGLAREALTLAEGPARVTGLVTLAVALAAEDPEESLRAAHEALRLAEVPHNQAWCHNHLGVALRIMGSVEEALDHHRRAFELLEPLAEAQLEIDFLPAYAETCRVAGRLDEALALHERTIELARKLGRPRDEQRARAASQEVLAGRPNP